jgi:hypothetical protein
MSPRHAARQPPGCRTGVAEPGPTLPRAGLALAKPGTPRAFHGLEKARSWADEIEGHPDRVGLQRPFDPLRARSTLARRERPRTPFRAPGLLLRFDVAPSWCLAAFLGRSAEMPRNRFYNRRFTSRAPASKHHLWRLPAARCGKPASARPRDRLRNAALPPFVRGRRRTTSRSSGLQQPRA